MRAAVLLTVLLVGCGSSAAVPTSVPAAATSAPTIAPTAGAITAPRLADTPAISSRKVSCRHHPDAPSVVATTAATPLDREVYGEIAQEEGKGFARRVQEAVDALDRLPGYCYAVTHFVGDFGPQSAKEPLLVRGEVASKDSRTWVVLSSSSPDLRVGRWAWVDGQAYKHIKNRWQKVKDSPFDPNLPLGFGDLDGEDTLLVTSYTTPTNAYTGGPTQARLAQQETTLASRPATRYDMEFQPNCDCPVISQSVWIARDGGYLLRHSYPYHDSVDGPDITLIEVTPLDAPPRIRVP